MSTIQVDNPATGEIVGSVPVLGSEQLSVMAARARAAQPGWLELGFEGRGAVMLRAQKWMLDNAERVIQTVISETGKTYEDAQLTDLGYAVAALGFRMTTFPAIIAGMQSPKPFTIGKFQGPITATRPWGA